MWEEIIKDLAQWREERHLSTESQAQGLFGNVLEECAELIRAKNVGDVEGMIDAICDVAVFTINAQDLIPSEMAATIKRRGEEAIKEYCQNNIFNSKEGMVRDEVVEFVYQVVFHIRVALTPDKPRYYNPFAEIMYYCYFTSFHLGYDFAKCMQETIKEISSRTGKWNSELGKFEKDTSDEAKARWYKADYSKCKF